MRRTVLLAGILPFVSACLGGVLAFSLMAAPQATAQSSQAQEVRASAFTLVAEDGTVLARLGPGLAGFGNLTLYDPSGTRRMTLAGAGDMVVWDRDGMTPLSEAGRTFRPDPVGNPPVNGVFLGPGGSISMFPSLP